MTSSPPKGPISKYYHTGEEISTQEFWGDKEFQSVAYPNPATSVPLRDRREVTGTEKVM